MVTVIAVWKALLGSTSKRTHTVYVGPAPNVHGTVSVDAAFVPPMALSLNGTYSVAGERTHAV